MRRRDLLKSLCVVPLAVQLGLTRLVPMSDVPAEELGGICSCFEDSSTSTTSSSSSTWKYQRAMAVG
jgi:hypothetical protein